MGYFLSLSKSATSTALDLSEWALLVFGLVLVVGIFGEYKKLPKRLLLWPATAFEVMVMIGVAGELMGDGGVFLFSRHLQTISDGEYAALDKEAGDARRDAGNANKDAGIARRDAADANKDAGEAKERADKLEVQAATLRKQAEDEHMARVRLQERVAWRTISPADIADIGTRLSVYRLSANPGIRVAVGTIADNDEAVSFSEDIADVLKAARWPFIGVQPYGHLGQQRFGLRISTTRDDPTRMAAQALRMELDALGFNPTYEESDSVFNGGGPGVYVFIELRPRVVPINRTTTNRP
jgi:hypothetical protein